MSGTRKTGELQSRVYHILYIFFPYLTTVTYIINSIIIFPLLSFFLPPISSYPRILCRITRRLSAHTRPVDCLPTATPFRLPFLLPALFFLLYYIGHDTSTLTIIAIAARDTRYKESGPCDSPHVYLYTYHRQRLCPEVDIHRDTHIHTA